jgi:hypothetical protein
MTPENRMTSQSTTVTATIAARKAASSGPVWARRTNSMVATMAPGPASWRSRLRLTVPRPTSRSCRWGTPLLAGVQLQRDQQAAGALQAATSIPR